ncbi:type VII secretion protein EssA [Alkalihalobacillus oceani]|uniref:Type VII secretion protein EssA n=1 Tax=Halalkalibacter oceani TaxID=1653776 RepID=A0A9X2DS38_9BACI|nr:type VII secretion protein EssA [Halalkalibacter oceani]MCM3715934.1 type VII secretion protein EssA [Halalkalibacter oceani]
MKSTTRSAKTVGRCWKQGARSTYWRKSLLLHASLICLALLLLLLLPEESRAEEEIVEPHRYEQGQVELNLDYFRDPQLQRREAMPEEQQVLTFQQADYKLFDEVERQLFAHPLDENHTIVVKAEQLRLFEAAVRNNSNREQQEAEAGAIQLTTILFSIVLLLVGVLFVIILPKLVRRSPLA